MSKLPDFERVAKSAEVNYLSGSGSGRFAKVEKHLSAALGVKNRFAQ